MFPAQPPHSRRMSPMWNDTDSMCVRSGRMWRPKRSGNTMMVSTAMEPQTSVRVLGMMRGAFRAKGRAAVSPLGATRRSGLAADLAHDVLLSPRHRQRFFDVAQLDLPVRVTVL